MKSSAAAGKTSRAAVAYRGQGSPTDRSDARAADNPLALHDGVVAAAMENQSPASLFDVKVFSNGPMSSDSQLVRAVEKERAGSGASQQELQADAATEAVENKGAGQAIPRDVKEKAEAHLDADLSDARVHTDSFSRNATSAMGARAFAYGNDVFVGQGESTSNTKLMVHELTHVVQQGAAKSTAPQGKLDVGAANSPAETEADAVADAVVAGQKPAWWLVDDGTLQPGQMLKAEFANKLEAAVTAAANETLGPLWSALGCPYIAQAFSYYQQRPAQHCERVLRKYAPSTAGAASADKMIAPVVAQVRVGVKAWVSTGEVPTFIAAIAPNAAASVKATGIARAQAKLAEAGSPEAMGAELGEGLSLGAHASRIGDAIGDDLSRVRVHTSETAARLAQSHGAKAFSFGNNIVFGAGEYRPGTMEGDALLAHEAAHTVQQKASANDAVARRKKLDATPSPAHEADADKAAGGVMARLYGGAEAAFGRVAPVLTSAISLARCEGPKDKDPKISAIQELCKTGTKDEIYAAVLKLAAAYAGNTTLRKAIEDSPQITKGQTYELSVMLELGARSAWPKQVVNWVDGVLAGTFTEDLMAPVGKNAIVEHVIAKAEVDASGGAAATPLDQYRARFNAKWATMGGSTSVKDHDPGSFVDPAKYMDGKGPRNPKARTIFEALYNDAALSVKANYDGDSPAGYRLLCDTMAMPSGFNLNASSRVQDLRKVFLAQAAMTVPSVADATYTGFVAKVVPVAQALKKGDVAEIQASNSWRAAINAKVKGPNDDVTTELRSDLLDKATNSVSGGGGGKAPEPPPEAEPTLTDPLKKFLSKVSFKSSQASYSGESNAVPVDLDVKSDTNKPAGVPLRSEIFIMPDRQTAGDNPVKVAWPDGAKKVHSKHKVDPSGAAAKTTFTANLKVPPVKDANFTPQSTTFDVTDDRLAWFKREVYASVSYLGDGLNETIVPADTRKYVGGQLPLELYAGLPTGNPGLNILVSGSVTPDGRAAQNLDKQPFPDGSDWKLVGDTILKENPPTAVLGEKISYELKFESGAWNHSVKGDFKAYPGGVANLAADQAKMTTANGALTTSTRAGDLPSAGPGRAKGGPLWEELVSDPINKPQQVAVAKGIKENLIKVEGMIVRSDSYAKVAAEHLVDPTVDPAKHVYWSIGAVDNAHSFFDSPSINGLSWAAFPNKVWLPPTFANSLPDSAESLTHEGIHCVDFQPDGHVETTWDEYESEFRSYYLANYADLSDTPDPEMPGFGPKTKRSRAVFEHMYGTSTYHFVKPAYDNNVDGFRTKVDNYLYPDGINLGTSKPVDDLRQVVDAYRSAPAGYAAVKASVTTTFATCSARDKAQIKGSRTWRDLVELRFTGTVPGSAPPVKMMDEIKNILDIAL